MMGLRGVVVSVMLVGLAACGGGKSGGDGGGNTVTGTFDESGSPCLTQDIEGSSTDTTKDNPQCTVVEHPSDGGSPVTFSSCIENGNQPPCWALTSCPTGPYTHGSSFVLNFGTTPPAGATFDYACAVVCLVGPDGSIC
jgi:hypothetical protein